ncbi:hypothetical protein JY97_12250 [Alkalispirochaeta odontotermitis]|nr:hypothetical protein JY97_12250 [Alkalispirochaeta odontotermitis]CAB1076019.1 hypothetical protein D1AOALGA4SA_3821 [Olavius algarvensis Delta 1 endosymbiont]
MFKSSPIPLWVNILLIVLIMFMAIQGYLFYFNHQFLLDAGITIEGVPDLNIIYTTAGRLLAMTAASVFVLYTQNPNQYLVVLFMSIFKDGQQTLIDPLFPSANAAPLVDFGMHFVIVALEIWAFIIVYRITRQENKDNKPA